MDGQDEQDKRTTDLKIQIETLNFLTLFILSTHVNYSYGKMPRTRVASATRPTATT